MDVSQFFAVKTNKRKQEGVVETYAVDDIIQSGHSFYQIDSVKVVQGRVKYIQTNLDGTQEGILIENDLSGYHNKTKLNSVEASKVKKVSKFVLKYNKYVKYFNSYKGKEIPPIDIHFVYEILMQSCGLTMSTLENVLRKIQGCQDVMLNLRNIIRQPFAFIRAEFQLISFEKAEFVDGLFDLKTTFEIKCSVWHFDFIHKYNSFYVEESYFYQCFERFCAKKEKEYGTYASMMRQSCITQLFKEKRYVTTEALLNIEKQLGDTLCELFLDCDEEIDLDKITDCICLFEIHKNAELCEEQRTAVINTVSKKLSIVTGYPGTGKTTIMECVVFVLKECQYANPNQISVIAPTGLAYVQLKKRLYNATRELNVSKEFSGTCHRVMYSKFPTVKKDLKYHEHLLRKLDALSESEQTSLSEYKKVDIDLIIIDEFSMVDTFMFSVILEYCVFFKCRLLLVGDENQLPSIGPGCILKSIIGSGIFNENISRLSVIHRQEAGILKENIQRMNTRLLTYDDFDNSTMVLKNINHFLCPKGLSIDPSKIKSLVDEYGLNKNNCKFLSYFRSDKYKFNVGNLNNIVQAKFITPTSKQHVINRARKFDIGDIIMRTENDYSDETEMRANGELAEIVDIAGSKAFIKYHDSEVWKKIDLNELENGFDLAYALTVHKSQGSQFDNIVIFIDNAQSCWDKQTLYTAISRASKRCKSFRLMTITWQHKEEIIVINCRCF